MQNWNQVFALQGTFDQKVPLYSVWGTQANDVWVVGMGLIAHWDGTAVTAKRTGAETFYGVWATPSTVWAVGTSGSIVTSTDHGATWTSDATSIAMTTNLTGIWGSDPTNLWAVGDQGVILKRTGLVWVPQKSGTTNNLTGISGTTAQTFWVVGTNGTVLQYRGP